MNDYLMIKHDRGYMELKIEKFFPCIQRDAKIIFPLINRWCSYGDKLLLKGYFQKQVEILEEHMKDLANKACSHPPKSKECKKYTAEFKKANTKCKRYKDNLKRLK